MGKNLKVPRVDSALYGLHSIRYHGTKLWAALPNLCKSAKNLADFKTGLKQFSGIKCKCRACKGHIINYGSWGSLSRLCLVIHLFLISF